MKFVSHQTTLHLPFKIKCCVDRLRPPEITRQDEYYLTRAETSIMRERQSDIADFVESDAILIEYGAGADVKTEFVLARLRDPRGYVPIDIADAFLAETSKRIASRFPSLWVRPIERNFLDVFEFPFDGSGGGRSDYRAEAKRVVVAYKVEEDGALSH